MFYVQKIQKSTFKKQVIVDGVLQSEDFTENFLNLYYNQDEDNFISDFSNKTLFSSLSDVYSIIPKKFEFDEEGQVKYLPEIDINSISKEEGIYEINDCLNFQNRMFDDNPTVEYRIVEE